VLNPQKKSKVDKSPQNKKFKKSAKEQKSSRKLLKKALKAERKLAEATGHEEDELKKEEEDYDYMSLLMNTKDELDELKEVDEGLLDEEGGEEGEDNEQKQEDFVEAMAAVHGKKKKITTNRGSDAPLTDDSVPQAERIELSDLLNTLDSDTRALSRRAEGEKAAASLAPPLERPAAERVSRQAGYSRVRTDVNLWDAVVHGRRNAETLTFPLINPDLKLQSADQVVKTRFSASTPLEQQVAAMLAGSSAVVQPGEEFSEIEKKGLEGLTRREIAERKAELSKFRALQTYQEAKYRRQNKIKSKKFRKILRKEKNKEKLKELESLAQSDPQAAAEELERMERQRIEERATLKHRNASKYLHDQAKRAKVTKDKTLAANVQTELNKHRELLAKPRVDSSSEDESEDEGKDIDPASLHLNQDDESFAEFNENYKKFYLKEQAKKEVSGQAEIEDMFEDAEFSLKQKISRERQRIQDEEMEQEEDAEEAEETGLEHAESLNFPNKSNKLRPDRQPTPAKKRDELDPDNFLTVETKKLKSDLPEIYGYNDQDDSDDETNQRSTIAEAFAEDDVVADFQKEKDQLVQASKPKDIDLTLPGWGEWGGGGLVPSKRKRKRFTIKAPPTEKRRDENKGNLIINTDKDDKIRAHKVGKVPFPFNSVSDFEASIRAPIGNTFLPRTAFLKLVKPSLETKMGEVIQPMDRSQLLNKNIQVKE